MNTISKNITSNANSQTKAHQKAYVKKDFRQELTDEIIELMEQGAESWKKTWKTDFRLPFNPVTKNSYNGINIAILINAQNKRAFSNSAWVTYKQAQEVGANVKKGEKGTTIVYFQMIEKKDVEESTQGETEYVPMMKQYTVFNLDQVENVPEELKPETPNLKDFNPIEDATKFILNTKAIINHGGDMAFYSTKTDQITLPEPGYFNSPEDYYTTALHELVHWTGHKDRLDRIGHKTGKFKSDEYAFEELVAELGAVFVSAHLGVKGELINHASYLKSWIKALKNDKTMFFKAAAQASKAFDYLLSMQ